jgi:hypothetical protein
MNLAIGNPNRFPHIYALEKLGGDRSPEGEKYYEEHEEELEMEFTEIMRNVLDRDNLGSHKEIHDGNVN